MTFLRRTLRRLTGAHRREQRRIAALVEAHTTRRPQLRIPAQRTGAHDRSRLRSS